VNIEEAIFLRYSCRRFARREIEPEKIDELLWAGQGESQRGKRTAPSAGGIYPVGLCTIKNVNLCRVKAPLAIVLTAKFNDCPKYLPASSIVRPGIGMCRRVPGQGY
jgi:hypothetical protein